MKSNNIVLIVSRIASKYFPSIEQEKIEAYKSGSDFIEQDTNAKLPPRSKKKKHLSLCMIVYQSQSMLPVDSGLLLFLQPSSKNYWNSILSREPPVLPILMAIILLPYNV
jgi:hypothetical protein